MGVRSCAEALGQILASAMTLLDLSNQHWSGLANEQYRVHLGENGMQGSRQRGLERAKSATGHILACRERCGLGVRAAMVGVRARLQPRACQYLCCTLGCCCPRSLVRH